MTDKIQAKIDNGTALSPVLMVLLMVLLRAGGLFETEEAEPEADGRQRGGYISKAPELWVDRRQAAMREFARSPMPEPVRVTAFECGDGPDVQGYMALYGRSASGREVYLGRFQDQPDDVNVQTLLNLDPSDNVTFSPDGVLHVNGEVAEVTAPQFLALAQAYGVPQSYWDRPRHGEWLDVPGQPGYCTPSRHGIYTGCGGAL